MSLSVTSSTAYASYPSASQSQTQQRVSIPENPGNGNGNIIDDIRKEYDQLNPEQQRSVDIYAQNAVQSYQADKQAERDATRNLALGANYVQHQEDLLKAYLQSSGMATNENSSTGVTNSAISSINQSLKNQQQVEQQLAIAEFYARYGGNENQAPKPTPYANEAYKPVSIAV